MSFVVKMMETALEVPAWSLTPFLASTMTLYWVLWVRPVMTTLKKKIHKFLWQYVLLIANTHRIMTIEHLRALHLSDILLLAEAMINNDDLMTLKHFPYYLFETPWCSCDATVMPLVMISFLKVIQVWQVNQENFQGPLLLTWFNFNPIMDK